MLVQVFFLAICVQWRDLRFAIRSVTGRGSASWDTQSSAHLSNLKWSYRILIATGLIILSILIMFICIESESQCFSSRITALTPAFFFSPYDLQTYDIEGVEWGTNCGSQTSLLASGILSGIIDLSLWGLSIKTYRSDQPQLSETGTVFRRAPPAKKTLSSSATSFSSNVETCGVRVTIDFSCRTWRRTESRERRM